MQALPRGTRYAACATRAHAQARAALRRRAAHPPAAQVSPSFATEDRWKHLGRQRDSTRALDGSASSATISTWGPQIGLSPGPVYLPTFGAVEIQSRSASFPGQSRGKSSAVAAVSGAKRPGPGAYNPPEQHAVLSTKPRVGRMTPFATDDRFKYLGEQLEGGTVIRITSPGPTYAPKLDLVLPSSGGVAFGQPRGKQQRCVARSFAARARRRRLTAAGRAAASSRCTAAGASRRAGRALSAARLPRAVVAHGRARRAMLLGHSTPGPGSYAPPPQAAVLSTKPNVAAPSFGKERRFPGPRPGESQALHSRRPITPGPKYLPNFDYVRPQSRSAKIGTAKRFSRSTSFA